MCKKSNLCNLLFGLSVLFLLVVNNALPSYAQPRQVGSALPRDIPTPTTSSPSTDYTYIEPAESYTPTSQAICDSFKKSPNYNGCYVQCRSYNARKSCTEFLVTFSVLLPYSKSETIPSLTFEQRQGESDFDFFQRYNGATLDQLLKAGINVNSSEAQDALLRAVANGQNEIASKLISAGTKIDWDKGGRVLLEAYDKTAILQLIKLGANVNAKVKMIADNQRTPLSMALSPKVDLEVVQALLTAGARGNESIEDGYSKTTPFFMAIENTNADRIALVKMFIAAGLRANGSKTTYMDYPTADRKENALMLVGCSNADSPELVRLLLEAGADPTFSFIDSEVDSKYTSVIKYFNNQTCPYKKQVIALLKQAKSK